ncbi:MAG: hypothetical protein JRM74_04885 [Nitrososphaerota archaeon]|nr:hypothetical protein [Nitrososphaerota archaeon]
MTSLGRRALYWAGFFSVVAAAVAVVAVNMYGSLTLTPIPPGTMSVFTYIGLKDLARGTLTSEALKTPALLAYALLRLGLGEFTATKGAALLSMAALPFAGGAFGFLATRSRVAGAASAVLLSLIPLSYLSAIGGDYAFVAAMVLVQFSLALTLLASRGGRRYLVPVLVFFSSVSAALAGLDVASAAWLLFGTSVVWGAYSLLKRRRGAGVAAVVPGVTAMMFSVIGPADPTEALRSAFQTSTVPQYSILVGALLLASAGGALALSYRRKWDALPLVSLLAVGGALVFLFGAETFLFVLPGCTALAMVPLLEARGAVQVVKEAGGAVSLEVSFEKAVAFSFALIMLTSPLVTGLGPGTAIQGSNFLGNEELQTINQVATLPPGVFGAGLVGAPASIAPWLRAELGVNTVLALSPQEVAAADAITSTSFRLRSSYLMVDDWTPFSSVRSPFIYAFDGAAYGAVAHLDDGTNQVNLASGGSQTSMGGMYLSGHSFTENGSAVILTMDLTNALFNVTKQIALSTDTPVVSVSYQVTPNHDAPASVNLPVYIEGEQKISSTVSGDTMRLTTSNTNMTVAFPGGTAPTLVNGTTQTYVESTFEASGGVVDASAVITVQSAKSSGEGAFYSSLIDAARSEGITSLLTFAPQPGLNFLGTGTGTTMALDIKDAFNRVLYSYNGTSYVESATNARVLSQTVSNSTCAASISYQTFGLDISKQVSATNDTVSLGYSVKPLRSGASLEEMNMTFWIPFGRTLLGYSTSNGTVRLSLDSGPVTITPTSGSLTGVTVGPDPVYGQLRAVLTFSLPTAGGSVGATMGFGRQVSCHEVLASRPVQNGTDELQLYIQYAPVLQVYSNQYFEVYQIDVGELPP